MNKRFAISLVVLIIYMVIIIGGSKLEVGSEPTKQSDMVARSISFSLLAALVFLSAVVAFYGWRQDVGLNPIRSTKRLLILWLPMLFIVGFFTLSFLLGFPPLKAFLFVGINTLMVGIGEELAFRGILFSGARAAFRPIGAIAITSVIFGAVHVLNGFTTGDWVSAAVQATAAGMSGLLFVAILIRTGSIIPAMVIHWLWDFGIFSMGNRSDVPVATETPERTIVSILTPILFVLPNFLYALWLLRGEWSKRSEDLLD